MKKMPPKSAENNILAKQCNDQISLIKSKYDELCSTVGLEPRYNRMASYGSKKAIDFGGGSGIIKTERNFATRNMAMGLRKPTSYVLTNGEINLLKEDIKAIGADERVFRFNSGRQTAYDDVLDTISVKGDVLPDTSSQHPRDVMSSRAVLAHEYYGHRAYRGTILEKGSWNDEFRASYMAAKNTPNLTDRDRQYLVLDALERAKEKGITIKHNDFIRRILYGY